MLDWFWRLFFGKKQRVPETTEDFENFAKSNLARRANVKWESRENIMCRYVLEIGKSPYKGDKDLKHAKDLLKKNGINFPFS